MWLRDLWDTFRTISIANIVDITVMACLLYLLLLWFKQTKAAFVARGIFIFAMVYVVAQQAGMYLTTWMFEGFFAIFLIALVVIFQEELRSFFERLAIWSLQRPFSKPLRAKQEVEILVRTAGELARKRIGALVVVKGRDPLERHIDGGEDLEGALSGPLLLSLFDPHSEGHDGAVVLEGDRVVRFGAHLPLSKEFRQLSGTGTRHAAALGLVERTDALCLVVSEERGAISLAKDGYIFEVKNLEALEEQLTTFLQDKAPVQGRTQWRDALRQHAMEKAIALVMAFALWLVFVQGFSPSSEIFRVPVQAGMVPDGLRVAAIHPANVSVQLKGLKRDLKLLNPLSLRVSVDLEDGEAGVRSVAISDTNLPIPGALQLANVDPPVVEFELAKGKGSSRSSRKFFGIRFQDSSDEPDDNDSPDTP